MEKILTIVVPSYNTSKYIDKAMQTFLDERFLDDIEVIVVNDGSRDDTAEKAAKYVSMHPQSIRLINKENGGHGSGINVGIREAKGKYFKVIDGDDFIDTEEMYRFIEQLKVLDADLFINYYTTVSEKTGQLTVKAPDQYTLIEQKRAVPANQVLPATEILPYVYGSIHAVTYRTSILKENRITMLEKTFYEDTEFVLYPMAYIKTAVVSEYNVYRYLIDQGNQSVSKINTQKRIGELEKVVCKAAEYYNRLPASIPAQNRQYILRGLACQVNLVYGVYVTFEQDIPLHRDHLRKFDQAVCNHSREVFEYAKKYRLVKLLRFGRFCFYPVLARLYQKCRN